MNTTDCMEKLRQHADALRHGMSGVDVERFRHHAEKLRHAGVELGEAAQRELERIGLRRTR